jgi:N-acetylglutamate synthase-like GNAT family acetyltransferase
MNVRSAELRPAQGNDLKAVASLLTVCDLPSSDLKEASLAHFHIAEVAGHLVGVVGFK